MALPGDLNHSGRVDGYDLILFSRINGLSIGDPHWNPDADLDANGTIGQTDLDMLSAQFGRTGVSFSLWVGQKQGDERLANVSSQGNILKQSELFAAPVSLAADESSRSIWVGDSTADKVFELADRDGTILRTIRGVAPYSVAMYPQDGSLWIADYANHRVVKVSADAPDGYHVGTDSGHHCEIRGFSYPRSISVHPVTGAVWVADTGNHQIVRVNPNVPNGYDMSVDSAYHVSKTGFNSPRAVAVNPADGTAWVADTSHDHVVLLSSSATTELARVGGFDNPVALSINALDGSVWVASTLDHTVGHLDAAGNPIFRGNGFDSPEALAVDPLTGVCWVADRDHNQLVKLSPSGTELLRVDGFTQPMSLSLIPDETPQALYPTVAVSLSETQVEVGQAITFTGIGRDPDGEIVRYQWDFDGDGIYDYDSSTSGVTTYMYPKIGVYTPIFLVTDNDWLKAFDYSHVVRVGSLQVNATADITEGSAPLSVNLNGSFLIPLMGWWIVFIGMSMETAILITFPKPRRY